MKPGLILPLLPMVLAMLMFVSGNKAEAAVSVGISVGEGRHYYRGDTIVYRTVDPGYSTWYPEYRTTREYPTVYRSSTYYESDRYQSSPSYGTYTTPYVYSSPSVDFNVWFGSDGHRHYGRRTYRR